MALTAIGDQTVADITTPEDNDRARNCKLWYAPTRDAVLRAHPWGFAKTRVALVLAAGTPVFGWDHHFTLPTVPYCLRVLGVEEDYPGQIPYAVEGRKLLCDEATIKILYVAQITDPTQFDSLFVEAFAAYLAENLAMALTKQKTLIDLAHNLYLQKLQEARTIDGMELTMPELYNQDLICVRGL